MVTIAAKRARARRKSPPPAEGTVARLADAGAVIARCAGLLGTAGDATLLRAVETVARVGYTSEDAPAAARDAIEFAADVLDAARPRCVRREDNLRDAADVCALRLRAALEDHDGDGSLIDGDLYLVDAVRVTVLASLIERATGYSDDAKELKAQLVGGDYDVLAQHVERLAKALDGIRAILYLRASPEMRATVGKVGAE